LKENTVVKIRLARKGAKKKPYHIVVADARAKRDGRRIERIGSYAPLTKEKKVTMDLERVKYWISVGAQPTERIQKLMKEVEGAQTEASEA
jgi:small subunit ribosomal protein S16